MAAVLNAVNSGDESTLAQLISNSPGSKNSEFQRETNLVPFTPLLRAVSIGSHAMALYLLEKGANPDLANVGGTTPLRLAAENGDLVMVRLLLDHGADPAADLELFDYVIPDSNINHELRSRIQPQNGGRHSRRRRSRRSRKTARKGTRRL